MEWQDISTAPKSFNLIVVLERGEPTFAFWQPGKVERFIEIGENLFENRMVDIGEWQTGDFGSRRKCNATHWIPLPSIPQGVKND